MAPFRDQVHDLPHPLPRHAPRIGMPLDLDYVRDDGTLALDGTRHGAVLGLLRRAGADPVVLLPGTVTTLLDTLDGVVLPGGNDVAPARYGEPELPELGEVVPAQDALDFAVADFALTHRLPTLGICRGLQVLNVALGGTLHQDIGALVPTHRRRGPHGEHAWAMHPASLGTGSAVRTIFDADRVLVACSHHQAVKDLAPALRVAARDDDGTVEAVELAEPSEQWLVATQWHPEAAAQPEDVRLRPFQALARATVGTRARSGRVVPTALPAVGPARVADRPLSA